MRLEPCGKRAYPGRHYGGRLMKVLVADRLDPFAITLLEKAGMRTRVAPELKGDELTDTLAAFSPQILIVRSTKVTAEMCASTDALELIIRAGAGVNTIDLSAAARHAICVSNCPGMNAVAVAELTLGHILNADRQIANNVSAARAGRWEKKVFAKSMGLKGATLGIIGFGAIGQAVASRAQAFGMNVRAWSSPMTDDLAEQHHIKWCTDLESLAARCDILSVHLPLTPKTNKLLGQSFFKAMKSNALFVNTARAEIVDETALMNALSQGSIRAALDVVSNEPKVDGPFNHPLAQMENVFLTHHIGASTQQAQIAVAQEAARVAIEFVRSGHAPNCVNLTKETTATHLLIIRHHDRVGVLAQILDILRQEEINVQGMTNEIFRGERAAACARIQVSIAPSVEVSARLRSLDDVISYNIVSCAD